MTDGCFGVIPAVGFNPQAALVLLIIITNVLDSGRVWVGDTPEHASSLHLSRLAL